MPGPEAMEQTASPRDLERRKLLKIRLRRDIDVQPAKYEGRTYYVVKDPVSLRYYRLKDNEHFLLQFMDGKHTLEDAQKSYEKHYRPDRLKLEDLEGFAQQLITAGLAQNDSPQAGKQLLDRRKKRKRTEWMQTFTNILYIKIPVIDPDRLLNRMVRPLGFVFSLWFFALSVAVMLGAVMLVATHFETFRSKLPDYHEFFSFKTVAWLWAALGCVKVIHEFGHGLSCKRFGGEVHEMGLLFLCFSPAMYCNVSDAWVLPNKWHRIIISAAGIYVELIIAAIATFVWWNTPSQPFVNNMALSLMVVCSVSTVVFNANPLMRYDGYYVLADWLEIPNLRERSNRFLGNLVLEHCLGVEVQPEPYMALWRRILFVVYAIASYIYKWVVTFAILWFMHSFLRPYKLEVISDMLAVAALGSLIGWPTYRFFKNIHRRGRLPDMKRWRVVLTGCVLAGVVLFAFLVPIPIGTRVRGQGLVQPSPDSASKIFVRHKGVLEKLNVRDGEPVVEGQELAVFHNPELAQKLREAKSKRESNTGSLAALNNELNKVYAEDRRSQIRSDITKVEKELTELEGEIQGYERTLREDLVLRAPRSGVVAGVPRPDEVNKMFEVDPTKPFLTVFEPGKLRVCLPVITPDLNRLKENLQRPTSSSIKTLRHLQDRVNVSYHEARLADVFADLNRQVKSVRLYLDPEVKQSDDLKVTYQARGQRLATVLDKIFEELYLGYVLVSDETNDHDGWLKVRPGRERGFAEGLRQFGALEVAVLVPGRDGREWRGKLHTLPESEAKEIPLPLSSKAGGPVAVKAGGNNSNSLVPQTQHYLVYIDLADADEGIAPGSLAQVKIYCKSETCAQWLWRKVNDVFDLGLI
jgi:putative peptide zinc metalloprotease protein